MTIYITNNYTINPLIGKYNLIDCIKINWYTQSSYHLHSLNFHTINKTKALLKYKHGLFKN